MSSSIAHIINHTHWDREWFLTSIYTSQWIAGLIDKVEQLASANPDFKYLLDGQTLIIEDLLQIVPHYESKVRRLVNAGHLIIGPYYCQPDWQLTCGELLIRNLQYGAQDRQRFGGRNEAGWLVDTFGHIAQAPQLHRLFGLDAIFVWRGVPEMIPYFYWQGSDGQQVLAINLFGGYRNLYGITHAPEVAITRLQAEMNKLRPYYPTPHIPLFDGYDLEEDPEDPVSFYRQIDVPAAIRIEESAPHEFVAVAREHLQDLPVLTGELNSGKYGATFPGTLSARSYLKIMHRDCEHALFHLAEPLAVLAWLKGRRYHAEQYEQWARLLLQNAVHDCICGVSIDQVHEKGEFHYRAVWGGVQEDARTSLSYILRDFAPGVYAVSTNALPYEGWLPLGVRLYPVRTNGVGVWSLESPLPVEYPDQPVEQFTWSNDHYDATVQPDGTARLGDARLGQLILSEEAGDTYSEEAGPTIAVCRPTGSLIIEERSDVHAVVRFDSQVEWQGGWLRAAVRLRFDSSPLLQWQVKLDSRGTNFRIEMCFETARGGQIDAGMPFDIVPRCAADSDLLPRRLEPELARVLLGQREIGEVRTFPFHDFLAMNDGSSCVAVLAKGVRGYSATEDGTISLTLRRSVEWLTAADLPHRVGDAGPFFYVPDARCERWERHDLAVFIGPGGVEEAAFQQLNAGFQNPPLLVEVRGDGVEREWQLLQEGMPLSSLQVVREGVVARFFNPAVTPRRLSRPYEQVGARGEPVGMIESVDPKRIVPVWLPDAPPEQDPPPALDPVAAAGLPEWRVGVNNGMPDPQVLQQLRQKIGELEARVAQIAEELSVAEGRVQYLLQHRSYIVERELYESRLSLYLNELKLQAREMPDESYLFAVDEHLADLGGALNRLRIKRRIYDYIVEAV